MKTTRLLTLIFTITILVSSCSKNETVDLNSVQLNNNLKQGSWKVSYFSEKGKDETSNFSGYTLLFAENGVFTFGNSVNTFTGTWSSDHQSDDNSNSSNKLIILITGSKLADDLQDDWIIIEMNENSIQLKDDNVSSDEFLNLTRI
jgi:hypothetical protein